MTDPHAAITDPTMLEAVTGHYAAVDAAERPGQIEYLRPLAAAFTTEDRELEAVLGLIGDPRYEQLSADLRLRAETYQRAKVAAESLRRLEALEAAAKGSTAPAVPGIQGGSPNA